MRNMISHLKIFIIFCCVVRAASIDSCDTTEFHPNLLPIPELKSFSGNVESKMNDSKPLMHQSEQEDLWSPCSATCGQGSQKKICERSSLNCDATRTRRCFLKFCPSYFSFPRIHFSGTFTADVSTLNNVRCNYVNNRFSAASMKEMFPILTKKGEGYVVETRSWNPDGSGRFRINAEVTSICTSAQNCSSDDAIIGNQMKETTVVAMVDIDPDWQLASEVYGMKIRIQGVLEAKFEVSAIQSPKPRGSYVYAALKSKLTNINWLDRRHKELFNNSDQLSIAMTMDQFVEDTRDGRMTGTIGMTSPDDPLAVTASRRMYPTDQWPMKGSAPFYVHDEAISVDLSLVFNCSASTGVFDVQKLGELDLAVDLTDDIYCESSSGCMTFKQSLVPITLNGELTKRMMSEEWYTKYGGIVDIDITHVSNDIRALMKARKIVLTQKKHGAETRIILSEAEHGISMGFMHSHVMRLNPGESLESVAFVSSFGKPVYGAKLGIEIVKKSFADTDCGWDICNSTLGVPEDTLRMSSSLMVNGVSKIKILAAKDPGNVRGCNLDGQIYPLSLRLKYRGVTYVEGGLLRQASTIEKDYDYYFAISPAVIAVYSEVPEIKCPTWQDVKDIFMRYHNLYPVMWKHKIIDMSSYNDVKRRSRMLKYAMFEVDFDDPRYMPITRDLSKSKMKLIKNWMECGMKERNEPDHPTCEASELQVRVAQLKTLLQSAVTLELTIIPPYFTAWLSLQTEYGRNRDTANILRSVFVDEMLHMSLAANMLNAINGTVNLTTFSNLPYYPTSVGFGDGYKLAPGLVMTLGKMSRGLVNDVFMPIEEPGDEKQRKILGQVSELLRMLGSRSTPSKQFMKHHHPKNTSQSVDDVNWNNIRSFSSQALHELSTTNITSIGAFYTMIALDFAFVESCFQSRGAGTLFSGNLSHQINMSHWHRPEDFHHYENAKTGEIQEFPIFEVKDLQTALQAIVAIIYEGEGGSSCTPYMKNGESTLDLPHFYRFMEIVHGRQLKKVFQPTSSEISSCLQLESDCDATRHVTNETMFCFLGDIVPFYDDGVWPIITDPDETMYPEGSEVAKYNKEFNLLYTGLLKCLENTFNGKPDHVKQCMQEMHSMQVIGKKVVQSPVYKNGMKMGHGTPTWVYQRNKDETLDIPTIQSFDDLY